jgi:hypothetical protein
MKRKLLTILFASALVFTVATPALVFAQATTPDPATKCEFDKDSQKLCNPVKTGSDLKEVLISLTGTLLQVVGVIAIVMIVIAGFRMVISGGNESQVKAAKSQLTWAVLGLILALLAYTIVAIVQNIIKG